MQLYLNDQEEKEKIRTEFFFSPQVENILDSRAVQFYSELGMCQIILAWGKI